MKFEVVKKFEDHVIVKINDEYFCIEEVDDNVENFGMFKVDEMFLDLED